MFPTMYNASDRGRFHPASHGDRTKKLYAPEYDADGVLHLIDNGEESLYDYIQSFKDSTDIHVLLTRYQNGDAAALSKAQGTYGDFTDMPKTYAEMLNSLIKGKDDFMKLPVELRAKFNHSFEEWISTYGSPTWLEKMEVKIDDVSADGSVDSDPVVDPMPSA